MGNCRHIYYLLRMQALKLILFAALGIQLAYTFSTPRLSHIHRRNIHWTYAKTEITTETTDYKKDIQNTALWVAAAGAFASGIGYFKGTDAAIEFVSGYALEQCLSVDNLFVFLVLFDFFKVKRENQSKVLSYGIWGAVVLRAIFIGFGGAAIENFHQVLIVFAGILLFSSYKILFGVEGEEEEDLSDNQIVKFSKSVLDFTDKFDGDNFFTLENGKKMATPLLLCLVCVELSDVVFALDSVPAVFGVTQDPMIVYTSNMFAIAGLRSLFGVLSEGIEDLKYLDKAVGVVLGVIGAKMIGETFDITILSPLQSLFVVLGVLGTGVAASLLIKDTDGSS